MQSRGGRELRKVCLSCILLLLLDGWSKLCSLTCLLSLCNCTYYVSSCFIFQISLTLATFDNIMHARVFLFLHQLETKNRIWNTKFLCLDFCCSHNHKREDASLSLFFEWGNNKNQNKEILNMIFRCLLKETLVLFCLVKISYCLLWIHCKRPLILLLSDFEIDWCLT